jgi:hypothetical protein
MNLKAQQRIAMAGFACGAREEGGRGAFGIRESCQKSLQKRLAAARAFF